MQHPHQQENADAEISIWTVIPVGVLIILVVALLVGGILRTAKFGPAVGDIVSFDRPSPALDQGPVSARVVDAMGVVTGQSCVLHSETMADGGGSLVLEERATRTGPFRVHWAGRRTSTGADDCGSAAELLVAPNDLLALAASAGGFGVLHKRLMVSASGLGAPTALVE